MRKGKEALLCCSGQVRMENRSGLIPGTEVDAADGTARRRDQSDCLRQEPFITR